MIRNLKKAISSRNAAIAEIENELQCAEFALTKAVYQVIICAMNPRRSAGYFRYFIKDFELNMPLAWEIYSKIKKKEVRF